MLGVAAGTFNNYSFSNPLLVCITPPANDGIRPAFIVNANPYYIAISILYLIFSIKGAVA